MNAATSARRLVPSTTLGFVAAAALLAGCGAQDGAPTDPSGQNAAADGIEIIASGLNNPASVSVSPDGLLTVCEAGPAAGSGNGRVAIIKDGKAEDYITDFPTEYWKVGTDGAPNRYKLGPLSAVWTGAKTLVVSNGGLADGEDHLLFFSGPGKAADGAPSTKVAKTSTDDKDGGEGNFAGLSASKDGEMIYVCGQGADAKSWLLICDAEVKELMPWASADDNGIDINSPMQTIPWDDDSVLVLYSGAGGKEDGLIVQWDMASKKPSKQWTLPGIFDPMGMARVPGTDDVVVVDNNWDLKTVKKGRLARVTLFGEDAGTVDIVREDLMGPTSCTFGPGGKLYITLLGEEFDADKGQLIAVTL